MPRLIVRPLRCAACNSGWKQQWKRGGWLASWWHSGHPTGSCCRWHHSVVGSGPAAQAVLAATSVAPSWAGVGLAAPSAGQPLAGASSRCAEVTNIRKLPVAASSQPTKVTHARLRRWAGARRGQAGAAGCRRQGPDASRIVRPTQGRLPAHAARRPAVAARRGPGRAAAAPPQAAGGVPEGGACGVVHGLQLVVAEDHGQHLQGTATAGQCDTYRDINTAFRSAAQRSTAQHSTAQHSTARHGTAGAGSKVVGGRGRAIGDPCQVGRRPSPWQACRRAARPPPPTLAQPPMIMMPECLKRAT